MCKNTFRSHSDQTQSNRLPEIEEIINRITQNVEYNSLRNNLNILTNLTFYFMPNKGNLYNSKNCKIALKEFKNMEFSFNNKFGTSLKV